MNAVQVRVLGPLEVLREGRACPVGSPMQRRLLTALVIAGGDTVSSDQLIDQLWGADPPAAARNSLQSHVARLRAILGSDTILTRPPGYALDLRAAEIDAMRFDRAVTRARGLLDADPAGAADTLVEALAAWRGEAHAEFADDLARADAVRLAQLRVDARCLLAEAWVRSSDASAAVDTLLRLVADEPLREDVALAAARCLHAVGRTTDALAVLRDHCARLVEELGLDPGTAVTALEQQLLRGEPSARSPSDPSVGSGQDRVGDRPAWPAPLREHAPTASTVPVGPPRPGTVTLGRGADLARVTDALERYQLVTLLGPGGVGKTRVAMVVANASADRADGRVAWIDLARVSQPTDVLPVVIDGLGVSIPDPDAVDAVARTIARFRGLIVLDNCEHVLDPVADLLERVFAQTGTARILTTSRERLDLAQERVIALAPLPVPDPLSATDDEPVVQLFQERLVAAGGAPVPAARAAEVAAAVDGLPLAIELAAARAATLTVDDLLERLDGHLDVLAGTQRRHGRRQRTLTSVIAWSHDLLTPEDRAVFRRMSVFASSFRLADAERIAGDTELRGSDVVDGLARLVEKSMIARTETGDYRLLEPLRLFAARQLADAPDACDTRRRHTAYVLDLAARADDALTGPDEAEVIREVEQALPDIRAAHARAVAAGDLVTVAQLAGRLYRFAYVQARADLLAWGHLLADVDDASAIDRDERLRAIAVSVPAEVWRDHDAEAARLAGLYDRYVDDATVDPWVGITLAETVADLRLGRGDLEDAVHGYERQTALARRCGYVGMVAFAQAGLSFARTLQGRTVEAEGIARRAFELASAPLVPTARSLASYAVGEALSEREPDAALDAFRAAAADAGRVNARFLEGIALTAEVALRGRHGDPDEALARYRAALRLWYDAWADGMAVTTLRNLVVLLVRTGADVDALTLHAAIERLASRGSFGQEAERLRVALVAAHERTSASAALAAARAGDELSDLAAAVRFGIDSIERHAVT